MQQDKPAKIPDKALWHVITEKINDGNYIFLKHARERLRERKVNDLDVINILENKNARKRKRNKSKDSYTPGYQDWNYCIEGKDLDGFNIRIIISFDNNLMLVITVIRIDSIAN